MELSSRAYSTLEIKSIDEDARIIEGIASTVETDRMGDVVEPKGAVFKLPLPLLWQHRSDQPIGHVIAAKVTDAGISIKAQIAKDVLPRIDEAWALIKSGLVQGLSIGFRGLEQEQIKGTFGLRFTSWEWLELSAVTIPANSTATIQNIRSLDQAHAASGSPREVESVNPAGVSATVRAVKARQVNPVKKTIQEQIKDFEATRAAKVAERDTLMDAAAEKGETLDAAQTEQYDALDVEVKAIDEHLKRLNARASEVVVQATEVQGTTAKAAAQSRGVFQSVSTKANREVGIGFARMVMSKMASFMAMKEGHMVSALDVAKQRWPSDTELHAFVQKTNIPAGTTTDTNWATELVEPTTLGSEFLEFLRAQTIIGKFGMNGVPALRSLPFNVRISRMTSGLTGYWVGEGLGKPVSKGAIDAVTLPYTKVAALTVITQELARFSSPSAERVVRDELARSVVARIDTDFVDPAIAATAAKPASLTNGLTALTSAGTTADNARTDLANLIEYFILNHMDVSSLVVLMPNTLALSLSLLRNSLGQQEFPGLTLNGGSLEGIPVITSQYLASGASYGNMVVALSANDIGLADDGGVDVKVSDQATIEMTDTPAGDATTPTAGSTAYVSMFQTNSLAILAERYITWKKLRTTAVVYMDDVNWGSIGSPV